MSISRIPDKSRFTNADVMRAVKEVHDCVHQYQEETTKRLEGNHIVISGQVGQVRTLVDKLEGDVNTKFNVLSASQNETNLKVARIEGVQSTVYGVKTSDTGKVTLAPTKANLLTLPWWQAAPILLALVAGGSGVYKVLVEVAVALNHYLMTAK